MTITFFGWIPTPTALSDFVEQTLIYQGLSVEFAALWLDEKICVKRFLKKIDMNESMLIFDLNSKKDSVDSEAIIALRSYSSETVKREFRRPMAR